MIFISSILSFVIVYLKHSTYPPGTLPDGKTTVMRGSVPGRKPNLTPEAFFLLFFNNWFTGMP